eukprot:TRINITY_DN2750_c0_g1_i4.p1 TRINITY_DN2750_c0_g1~~TRINITY_DN2750_c0_g1_i4.p1  ORF type:complete len:112 (+),score=24.04 TRINITY_DN2750_c0_g1_i4:297-632(+)
MANNAGTELYRLTTLGVCLIHALDQLQSSGQIPPTLVDKVLKQFDKSMHNALMTKVRTKAHFKGTLKTYRFCDNVWTFIIDDVVVNSEHETITADQLKVVCCDSSVAGVKK